MLKKQHLLPAFLLITATPALWSVAVMTDATFGNVVNNQSELLSFEANNSGTTLQIDSIATTTHTQNNNPGWHLGSANTLGEPASPTVAISDDFVTTNMFGLENNVLFSLNTTVNDGDGKSFFLVEHIGNDDGITVTPTSAGSAIGTWSLTLDAADYAAITTVATYDWENQGNALAGTVFTLADFSGGTGTLTGVDGLLIDGDGRLDPALIGVASAVPEPSTYAALAGVLALGVVMLRRRRS
jgi:hypothetical protein